MVIAIAALIVCAVLTVAMVNRPEPKRIRIRVRDDERRRR